MINVAIRRPHHYVNKTQSTHFLALSLTNVTDLQKTLLRGGRNRTWTREIDPNWFHKLPLDCSPVQEALTHLKASVGLRNEV